MSEGEVFAIRLFCGIVLFTIYGLIRLTVYCVSLW